MFDVLGDHNSSSVWLKVKSTIILIAILYLAIFCPLVSKLDCNILQRFENKYFQVVWQKTDI